jgi:hypothetical protein|tara:strand:- start:419 stop:1090 length:672 start_codon:yes stop_codon:yes gene_type:complete
MSETEHDFTTKTGNNITFYNLEEKECPRCFSKFFPKHPRTVYCKSDECIKIGYRVQASKNRKVPSLLPIKTCIICEKDFRPRDRSNKGICGDTECRYKHRLKINRDNKARRKRKPDYKPGHIKTYGLTLEQYEAMVEYQDHKCKICGIPETENSLDKNGNPKRLSIDHDHETGQIRGLLCNPCNTALGSFRDNVESLQRAILYLEGSKNSTVYKPQKKPRKKI